MGSHATHQWLSVDLGIVGLKRLAKSIDASLASVYTLLSDAVSEASTQLLITAGELNGFSALEENAGSLGLRQPDVAACMQGAEQTHACMLQASRACAAAAFSYRQLFLWLQRCQKRCVHGHRSFLPFLRAVTHMRTGSMMTASQLSL